MAKVGSVQEGLIKAHDHNFLRKKSTRYLRDVTPKAWVMLAALIQQAECATKGGRERRTLTLVISY